MTNERITIHINPLSLIARQGKSKGARLYWQSPGLDIYITVGMNNRNYDKIAHLAMTECLNRNIPLMAMRKVSK